MVLVKAALPRPRYLAPPPDRSRPACACRIPSGPLGLLPRQVGTASRRREINFERCGPLQSALNESFRQWVFDVLLQRAPERPRAIISIAAGFLENPLARFRRQRNLHLAMHQRLVDLADEQIDNPQQVVIRERIEQNHFVQSIQEFGIENSLHLAHHHVVLAFRCGHFVRRLEAEPRLLLQLPRADVRRQDNDCVAEVHCIAEPVRQLPVFEDLQQNVVHVRMRLLNFVEQNHRVRRAAHAFGQLAAFFVSHVSWRRADQFRHGMLLHVFGHVEADERFFAAE